MCSFFPRVLWGFRWRRWGSGAPGQGSRPGGHGEWCDWCSERWLRGGREARPVGSGHREGRGWQDTRGQLDRAEAQGLPLPLPLPPLAGPLSFRALRVEPAETGLAQGPATSVTETDRRPSSGAWSQSLRPVPPGHLLLQQLLGGGRELRPTGSGRRAHRRAEHAAPAQRRAETGWAGAQPQWRQTRGSELWGPSCCVGPLPIPAAQRPPGPLASGAQVTAPGRSRRQGPSGAPLVPQEPP